MQVEPPGPHVHGGSAATGLTGLTTAELRLAAGAGAAALVLCGRGDAFLLALLLGVTAFDVLAGLTAGTVATVLLARWGSSSLAAAAGAQSVLGLGFLVGPLPSAAAVVLAAAALFAVAPADDRLRTVFGAAAGIVLAGPSFATLPGAVVRLLAIAAGAAAAWYGLPRVPERIRDRARPAAPAVGGLAVLLAAVA
jgi:hypothetical protein